MEESHFTESEINNSLELNDLSLIFSIHSVSASTSTVNVVFGPVLVKARFAAVAWPRTDGTGPRLLHLFAGDALWGRDK